MDRIKFSVILLVAFIVSGCAESSLQKNRPVFEDDPRMDPLVYPADYSGVFYHSDIALMPEWEPTTISVLKPLKPTVVAWGNDAVFNTVDQLTRKIDDYDSIGVRLPIGGARTTRCTKNSALTD